MSYDPGWRNRVHRRDGTPVRGLAVGEVPNDDRADWREAWAQFSGDVAYVWHAGLHTPQSCISLEAAGFDIRAQIIWAKSNFAIGRGHYHWQHEPAWYAVRSGQPSHFCGGHTQTTLWQIAKPHASETGHSAQKPVECMKRPIENSSRPGEAVYDPFVGSGANRHVSNCGFRSRFVVRGRSAGVRRRCCNRRRHRALLSRHAAVGGLAVDAADERARLATSCKIP